MTCHRICFLFVLNLHANDRYAVARLDDSREMPRHHQAGPSGMDGDRRQAGTRYRKDAGNRLALADGITQVDQEFD